MGFGCQFDTERRRLLGGINVICPIVDTLLSVDREVYNKRISPSKGPIGSLKYRVTGRKLVHG